MEIIEIQKNKIFLNEKSLEGKNIENLSLVSYQKKISKSNQKIEFNEEEKKNYLKNVIKISDLFLITQNDIIFSKPTLNKIIQVTIYRDKSNLKNKLFPKYHIYLSSNFEYYIMSVKKVLSIFGKKYIFSSSPSNFKNKSNSFLGKLKTSKKNYLFFSKKKEQILTVNFVI